MKRLLLLCILAVSTVGRAQDSLFSKVFYVTDTDLHFSSAVLAPGDGLLIAGDETDSKGLLIRHDSLGNLAWKQLLSFPGSQVELKDVALAVDSSFLVTGRVGSMATGTYKGLVARVSADGDVLWSKKLSVGNNLNVNAFSVTGTVDSACVVAGYAYEGQNLFMYVAKMDHDGVVEWSHVFQGGYGPQFPLKVKQAPDSSFWITGGGDMFTGESQLLKISGAGVPEWAKVCTGVITSDLCFMNEGVVVAGKVMMDNKIALLRFDGQGANAWKKHYDAQTFLSSDEPVKMDLLSDSSLAIVQGNRYSGRVFRVDAEGEFIAGQSLELGSGDVVATKNGGMFVVGEGPLFGIKNLMLYAHLGVIRLDSLLEGNSCTVGTHVSVVADVAPGTTDITLLTSGTLTAEDIALVAGNPAVQSFSGCVDHFGGLDEHGQPLALTVFPNSSSGKFNFMQETEEQIRIVVYNLAGVEVYQVRSSQLSTSIDLSGRAGGMYLFRAVDTNGRSASGKLILEK